MDSFRPLDPTVAATLALRPSPSVLDVAHRISTYALTANREAERLSVTEIINYLDHSPGALGDFPAGQVDNALNHLGHSADATRDLVLVLTEQQVAHLDSRVLAKARGIDGPFTPRDLLRRCRWDGMYASRLRGCLLRLLAAGRLEGVSSPDGSRGTFLRIPATAAVAAAPTPLQLVAEAYAAVAASAAETARLLQVADNLRQRYPQPAESPAVAAEPSAGAPGDPGAAAGL